MHSGVFNVLCQLGAAEVWPADVVSIIPRQTAGRIASEAFYDCLPAELGVTAAGKRANVVPRKGYYSTRAAVGMS